MELEEIKAVYQQKKSIGYSQDELDSIYHIKQQHGFKVLKTGFSWDLIASIFIATIFIVLLQYLDLRTSVFWSICMAVLVVQHILFYLLQNYFIRKLNTFENNISLSLKESITKLRGLLWFYRLWPAILSTTLYSIYLVQFSPELTIGYILLIGILIAISVAGLSNIVSAVLVRKHYQKLILLKEELESLSD